MTTPEERTRAVVGTREFLQMLASASTDDVTIPGPVQSAALCLLRHYPLNVDLDFSASVLPTVWAPPSPRRGTRRGARLCIVRMFRRKTGKK
jgi:hypothetical protein